MLQRNGTSLLNGASSSKDATPAIQSSAIRVPALDLNVKSRPPWLESRPVVPLATALQPQALCEFGSCHSLRGCCALGVSMSAAGEFPSHCCTRMLNEVFPAIALGSNKALSSIDESFRVKNAVFASEYHNLLNTTQVICNNGQGAD